jgi:hypothetical protein
MFMTDRLPHKSAERLVYGMEYCWAGYWPPGLPFANLNGSLTDILFDRLTHWLVDDR